MDQRTVVAVEEMRRICVGHAGWGCLSLRRLGGTGVRENSVPGRTEPFVEGGTAGRAEGDRAGENPWEQAFGRCDRGVRRPRSVRRMSADVEVLSRYRPAPSGTSSR